MENEEEWYLEMLAQWLDSRGSGDWGSKYFFYCTFFGFISGNRKTLLYLLKSLQMTFIINVTLAEGVETIQASYCKSAPDSIKD